jgi:predicted transcriptional regulator of viral defense system
MTLPDMPFSDVPSSIPAGLLETQAGIVSVVQLSASGVSIELAKKRAMAGRWQRIHRGVFAVFSGPVNRPAQVWAALLRCGTGATASHVTAAELDALCERVDERIHVTIPAHRRVRGRYEGIVVHHAHRLGRSRHPTRLPRRTRIEATVLDLVDVSETAREVEAWIVAACQKRLTTPTRLGAALAERKKITWRAMAEAMLLDVAHGAQFLRSVERAHRLPRGDRQRRVAMRRVIWIDVDYLPFRTRVELDGRLGHEGEGQIRDRRRDNRATVGRTWSLRYGHAEVFGDPCAVAAEVSLVLRERGWAGTAAACGTDCGLTRAFADLNRPS